METTDSPDLLGDVDAWSGSEGSDGATTSSPATLARAEAADGGDPFSLPTFARLFAAAGGNAGSLADPADAYVIETPLFPIILPKAWQPPAANAKEAWSTSAAASMTGLEISVAMDEEAFVEARPAAHLMQAPAAHLMRAATRPMLPKDAMSTFTGREFYYPESIEALAETGMRMTLGTLPWEDRNDAVVWSGEKGTDKFVRDHGEEGLGPAWHAALDSSQEVLVWAGKFSSGDGHGAELPVIKTVSIVNKSPRYLAELIMDSERVKAYNKMSLGRTDERVFQEGIDTQGGSFGDGEFD